MALPPKSYDNDEIRRLRQVRYEKTGQWKFASPESIDATSGTLRDQYGNRLYDDSNRAIRGYGVYNTVTGAYEEDYQQSKSVYNPKNATGSSQLRNLQAFNDSSGLSDEELDELNQRPVALTQIPTSSSNAARPRTVAAGYTLEVGWKKLPEALRKGRLTVMFRDGTLWNYYDVPHGEWLTFSNSLSKGPMLNRASKSQAADGVLLSHPHGPADLSDIPEDVQKKLWVVSREAQLRYKTKNRARAGYKSSDGRVKGQQKPRAKEYVPLNASKKSGYNPNANRGKAPKPRNPASRP